MKIVEIPLEDFEALVEEIRLLKKEIEILENANKFLNNEIEEFNKMSKKTQEKLTPKK